MSSCSAICEIESPVTSEPPTPEMSSQFKVMPYEDNAEQAFGPIAPFAPIKSALAPLQTIEELNPKKLVFEEDEPTWGWNGIPGATTFKYRGEFQSPRPHFPGPCALVRSTNADTPDASPKEPEVEPETEPNFNDIPPPPVLRRNDSIGSYVTVPPLTVSIGSYNCPWSRVDSSSCTY